jgi:hypothetical protein
MLGRPDGGQVHPAGLGEQQLQVGTQVASDNAPGDKRPGLGTMQVSHTLRGWAAHPDRGVGMAGQEPPGGAVAVHAGTCGDRQASDVAGVGVQQVHRQASRAFDREAHRAPARALAYSAASVATDRWT